VVAVADAVAALLLADATPVPGGGGGGGRFESPPPHASEAIGAPHASATSTTKLAFLIFMAGNHATRARGPHQSK